MRRALLAGTTLAVFGTAAVWLQQPALFPALGPSLYLLAVHPGTPTTAPRRIGVAHLLGLVIGAAARALLGSPGSSVLWALAAGDVLACVVSLALVTALLPRLDADHPPAAASTLIAATGAFGGLTGLGWAAVAIGGLVGVAWAAHAIEPSRSAAEPGAA